ncbi:hypothetical protein LCGC14_0390180 [marine sediment metagenome]|uniref:Uncharacterized protein n=1 Tax=marine sediment metagenome TaxID=412755 RepID=A0A0F9VLY3_9ZZZZ
MFSKLGTSVALEMEEILSSDAHNHLFYKQAADKCDCPKNCACKQDGKCEGACPCDKKKCKCPKGCDKCDCTETKGKCPCVKVEKKAAAKCKCCTKGCDKCTCEGKDECECKCKCAKKAEALQDLSYTLSKVSADLDDAGYVKSSIAVMRALDGLISEADPLGISEPIEELQLPLPEPDPVPHEGIRGIVSDETETGPQMDLEDIGAETVDELIDKIHALLQGGKYREADKMMETLSTLWEEDDDIPPPPVEDLTEEEMGVHEPMTGNAPEGAPEGLGLGELENVHSELDAWLEKNANVVHRFDDPMNPELALDLDLKDLLTVEDGVDVNLIDAYLSELDGSFEDE